MDDEKYCSCGNVLNEEGACPRCELEPYEHRGSVMPAHMASVDPEKLQGFPEEMRPRIERHLGGRG